MQLLAKTIRVTYVTGGVDPAIVDRRGLFARCFVDLAQDLELLKETFLLVINRGDGW